MSEITEPTSEKIQTEFLTCPICYEIYNEPKCLPCLHTLCGGCLRSYIQSQTPYGAQRKGGYPCPVCKRFINVKNPFSSLDSWVEEVQNNFLIQNMIDMIVHNTESSSQSEESIPESDQSEERSTPSAPPSAPRIPYSHFLPRQTSLGSARNVISVYLPNRSTRQPSCPPPPPRPSAPPSYLTMIPSSSVPNVNITAENQARRTSVTSLYRTRVGETTPPTFNPNASASFTSISTHERYYMTAARNWNDYCGPKISDVISLPKNNGIALLDWTNRSIKFIKNFYLGRNVTTSMEVVGRPCSFAILDPSQEDVVVITLLGRKKLYLVRVPDLEMYDVLDVQEEYRGVTVLSNTRILVSSEKPPAIDLITLNSRRKVSGTTRVYQQGRWDGSFNFDLYKPYYMVRFSPTLFAVSDAQRNCIICFGIQGTKVSKLYTLNPPEHSAIRNAGGMCFSGNSLYLADGGNHEILKISFGSMVKVETVLRRVDGIHKPSSVSVGPNNEIVVSNWEGNVSLYKRK